MVIPDMPVPFGYKTGWLAIKTRDSQAVIKSLNLKNVTPANWEAGIDGAYADKMFVSPVLGEWILVIGKLLPYSDCKCCPDRVTPLITRLSWEFGEAHYYATHRVVEYHVWVMALQGQVVRAYTYVGDQGVTRNIGKQTNEEIELGFRFFEDFPPEGNGSEYWDRKDLRWPNEQDVMDIASKWSIDPLFRNNQFKPGTGFLCSGID